MDIKKIQEILDAAKDSELAKKSQQKLNVALGNKEKALDEEFRKKQYEASTSEDAIKKRIQSLRAFNKTEAGKLSRKQQVKKMKSNKGWVKNVKKSFKNLHNDPKFKKEHAERNKEKLLEFKKTEAGKQHQENLRQMRIRPVTTPYGKFESITDFHKFSNKLFHEKIKQMPHLYYYDDLGPGEIKYEKVLHSPYGSYGSKGTKTILYGRAVKNNDKDAIKAGNAFGWWAKMSRNYPEQYYETREPKREWDLEDD